MNKILPQDITSYDLLKAVAILLMIADHVGHHFFPDEMWFRTFGRLCLPIWFFLVGYARTTELRKDIWIGAGLVFLSSFIAGQYLLPLNILFTILIMRYFRPMAVRALYSPEGLRGMYFLLLMLVYPSAVLFEYGSAAMFFVLFGYIVRHKDDIYNHVRRRYIYLFCVASFLSFYVIQGLYMPHITIAQIIVMFIGYAAAGICLWFFKPYVFAGSKARLPGAVVTLIQVLGRRTLEIYVLHIIVFRGVCMYLFPDRFAFWEWEVVPQSVIRAFL